MPISGLLARGTAYLTRKIDTVTRHPVALWTLVASLVAVSWITAAGLVWFSVDLIRSTPRKSDLARVGDMAQASTLLASDGRPAGQGGRHRGHARHVRGGSARRS